MDSYDSDSDLEDASYVATDVIIGFASEEPTDDNITLLGGHPNWIDDKTTPSGALAKCKICNSLMSLLIQVNGAVPSKFPSHDRRLYLFSCRRKVCRRKDASVRGIRGNRVHKTAATIQSTTQDIKAEQKPQVDIGAQLFGSKASGGPFAANPFAAPPSSGSSAPSNPFSSSAASNPFAGTSSLAAKPAQNPADSSLETTFAQKVRLSEPAVSEQAPRPHEPWPAESDFPKPYPQHHLEAESEEVDERRIRGHLRQFPDVALRRYEEETGAHAERAGFDLIFDVGYGGHPALQLTGEKVFDCVGFGFGIQLMDRLFTAEAFHKNRFIYQHRSHYNFTLLC